MADIENEKEQSPQAFYDIIGAAYESANWFKQGMHENVYEVGMKIELEAKGYKMHQQKEFPVYYKGAITDKKFRMDLVLECNECGNIIIELKALNAIDDKQRKQLCSYMRLTNTRYGILINFSPQSVYSEKYEYISAKNKFKKL